MKTGSPVYGKWHFRHKGYVKPAEIERGTTFAKEKDQTPPSSEWKPTLPDNQPAKVKVDRVVSKNGRPDAIVLTCDEIPGKQFTVRQAAALCGRSTAMVYNYVRTERQIAGKYTFRKCKSLPSEDEIEPDAEVKEAVERAKNPAVIGKAEQIDEKYAGSNGDEETRPMRTISSKDKHCPSCNYTGRSDHPQKCPRCGAYQLEPATAPSQRYRQLVE
jgi:hypothetical protein